jgi:hypothetical protein
MPGRAQPGTGPGPGEGLLDPLADAPADGIGVTRRPAIDRRPPPADAPRHVRSDVQLNDEVLRVDPLIAAQRDRLRPIGVRRDQVQGCQPA